MTFQKTWCRWWWQVSHIAFGNSSNRSWQIVLGQLQLWKWCKNHYWISGVCVQWVFLGPKRSLGHVFGDLCLFHVWRNAHVFSLLCLLYVYSPTPIHVLFVFQHVYIYMRIYHYFSLFMVYIFCFWPKIFCLAKYNVLARTALGIATLAVLEDFGTQEVSSSFGQTLGAGC